MKLDHSFQFTNFFNPTPNNGQDLALYLPFKLNCQDKKGLKIACKRYNNQIS